MNSSVPALTAAQRNARRLAVGAWFAGVDLLYDRDGRCCVIEVNAVPGWKAFARVNRLDVAATLLARIAARFS